MLFFYITTNEKNITAKPIIQYLCQQNNPNALFCFFGYMCDIVFTAISLVSIYLVKKFEFDIIFSYYI